MVLHDGAARSAPRTFSASELTQPGDTAVITSVDGKITIQKTNTPPWTFAGNCGAAAGLCTTTQFADASPTITPAMVDDPTGMLCGK